MWVKSTKHVKLIQRCLDTTQALKSNLLRHGTVKYYSSKNKIFTCCIIGIAGICRTIWSVSLCPIFQELAVLMDKTGRLPKNFVSRKINLHSPDQAIPFLQVTKQLLDMTITVLHVAIHNHLPILLDFVTNSRPCLPNWNRRLISATTTCGRHVREQLL